MGEANVQSIVSFGVPRERVPMATHFRTTWLSSSLRSLRERGLLDAYLRHLPSEYHGIVTNVVVGEWQPTAVALAHYEACDKLQLSIAEMISIGEEVTMRARGSVFGTMVKLARHVGVTPWLMLENADRMWKYTWQGGGVAIHRLSPSKARVEIAGFPPCRTSWCRYGMRGVLHSSVGMFAQHVITSEITELYSPLTIGYFVQWS